MNEIEDNGTYDEADAEFGADAECLIDEEA